MKAMTINGAHILVSEIVWIKMVQAGESPNTFRIMYRLKGDQTTSQTEKMPKEQCESILDTFFEHAEWEFPT